MLEKLINMFLVNIHHVLCVGHSFNEDTTTLVSKIIYIKTLLCF